MGREARIGRRRHRLSCAAVRCHQVSDCCGRPGGPSLLEMIAEELRLVGRVVLRTGRDSLEHRPNTERPAMTLKRAHRSSRRDRGFHLDPPAFRGEARAVPRSLARRVHIGDVCGRLGEPSLPSEDPANSCGLGGRAGSPKTAGAHPPASTAVAATACERNEANRQTRLLVEATLVANPELEMLQMRCSDRHHKAPA